MLAKARAKAAQASAAMSAKAAEIDAKHDVSGKAKKAAEKTASAAKSAAAKTSEAATTAKIQAEGKMAERSTKKEARERLPDLRFVSCFVFGGSVMLDCSTRLISSWKCWPD